MLGSNASKLHKTLQEAHVAQELASHGSEQDAQLCKLSQELAEYKAESKELKNQDGTIRRLEERVRSLDAQVQEKVRSFLLELQEVHAPRASASIHLTCCSALQH